MQSFAYVEYVQELLEGEQCEQDEEHVRKNETTRWVKHIPSKFQEIPYHN